MADVWSPVGVVSFTGTDREVIVGDVEVPDPSGLVNLLCLTQRGENTRPLGHFLLSLNTAGGDRITFARHFPRTILEPVAMVAASAAGSSVILKLQPRAYNLRWIAEGFPAPRVEVAVWQLLPALETGRYVVPGFSFPGSVYTLEPLPGFPSLAGLIDG